MTRARTRPPFLLRLGPVAACAELVRVLGAGAGALRLASLCLPRRAAALALLILVCSAAPPLLLVLHLLGLLATSPLLDYVAGHPMLSWALVAVLAVAGLLVFERPRSWAPRAYFAQLRARADDTRAQYHAAVRGRSSDSQED